MNKYYALIEKDGVAELRIYGEITAYPWEEYGEVSAATLAKELDAVTAGQINVRINSYGGDVAEGLAIYNALRQHSAKVTTYCDGFACSAAAVIFMAGDERIMGEASLLMIHNAWTRISGNADELRKQADDLDVISDTAANAFRAHVNISDEELKTLLTAESWLPPARAVEKGFATGVYTPDEATTASMSVQRAIIAKLLAGNAETMDDALQKTNQRLDEVMAELASLKELLTAKEPEPEEKPKNKKYFKIGG